MDVEKVIREYLPEVVHMSLATVKDNAPWVCEVHFAYDGDLNLYFRSLPSRRHSQEIAANPKVAGNIIKQHSLGDEVVGIYFEGSAKMLEPGAEQNRAFESMQQRLGLSDDILEDAKHEDGTNFIRSARKTGMCSAASEPRQGKSTSWSGAGIDELQAASYSYISA